VAWCYRGLETTYHYLAALPNNDERPFSRVRELLSQELERFVFVNVEERPQDIWIVVVEYGGNDVRNTKIRGIHLRSVGRGPAFTFDDVRAAVDCVGWETWKLVDVLKRLHDGRGKSWIYLRTENNMS